MSTERELLRRMLELYSPTGQEAPVAQLLADHCREAGLRAGCDEAGNFVATVGEGPAEVVLLGHIDTVPGEIAVEERAGRLYGRGAVDAKGPMASFVSASLRLAARGAPRSLKLTLIGAVGEEGDSRGARHIVDRYRPRYLVIGEPSGWDSLVLGYKGSMRLTYRYSQSARHSAGPDEAAP
ncbi:MAG: M20/M25/M40 family metallo-hydrolase, partial [Chloroflexota bacterium]|nr:M20/M25/M40 family metallo-hydrolase [Chloroflexota bacterium]